MAFLEKYLSILRESWLCISQEYQICLVQLLSLSDNIGRKVVPFLLLEAATVAP